MTTHTKTSPLLQFPMCVILLTSSTSQREKNGAQHFTKALVHFTSYIKKEKSSATTMKLSFSASWLFLVLATPLVVVAKKEKKTKYAKNKSSKSSKKKPLVMNNNLNKIHFGGRWWKNESDGSMEVCSYTILYSNFC